MGRPTNKEELLALSGKNYEKLNSFIDQFNPEEQQKEFSSATMNRNIRDVLAHLHHWHLMMLEWYKVGMSGEKPDIPAAGYTWKTVPQLNRIIWQKFLDTSLDTIRKRFAETHMEVVRQIQKHSNEELFEKKRYQWTGTTSLGAYLISATSSHYDWALKLIKKGMK